MSKFIVTAAITGGIHTPSMSPYLPITPDQIAEESRRAYEAGAAVVHVHPRDPETGQPSADVDLFGDIITKIKSKCNVDNQPIITLDNITIRIRDKLILANTSWLIKKNQHWAIIGPNGAGKSSFVRAIVGELPV